MWGDSHFRGCSAIPSAVCTDFVVTPFCHVFRHAGELVYKSRPCDLSFGPCYACSNYKYLPWYLPLRGQLKQFKFIPDEFVDPVEFVFAWPKNSYQKKGRPNGTAGHEKTCPVPSSTVICGSAETNSPGANLNANRPEGRSAWISGVTEQTRKTVAQTVSAENSPKITLSSAVSMGKGKTKTRCVAAILYAHFNG
jgi:hypothetical protein